MQAIHTKYHGPTNRRNARIVASYAGGRLTVPWDFEKDIEANHRAAAFALAKQLEWWGQWVTGVIPSGDHVHVCVKIENGQSQQWEVYHGATL